MTDPQPVGGTLRRLGVMGGTFDPIHHGHLVAASEVAALFDLDRVVFVPAGIPWMKNDRQVAAAEHRFLMTFLATAADPRFDVSRVDIDRPGLTYTADTLTDLRDRLGETVELFFITGADSLNQIMNWRDLDRVLRLAKVIGVSRPGHEWAELALPTGSYEVVDIPALAISSSECRSRVRDGQPISYLVPRAVEQYIGKTGLYQDGSELTGKVGSAAAKPRVP